MCLGEPMRLVAIDGIAGRAEGIADPIDLSLTPQAQVGDWVLAFLGASRAVVGADEARLIASALDGLRAVMAGGDPGDAFADLDTREPALPPHLQAAFDAGHTQG